MCGVINEKRSEWRPTFLGTIEVEHVNMKDDSSRRSVVFQKRFGSFFEHVWTYICGTSRLVGW